MLKDGLLDTSNYPASHPLYTKEYKARLGCVKDESGGATYYTEWVLLRPKLYSMITRNNKEHKRAKGIQRSVVNREITHNDYVLIFQNSSTKDVTVRRFDTQLHQIRTIQQRKRALSVFDDKRVWTDGNSSVAYGHYKIKRLKCSDN
jgi:hypothetical protein